MNPTRTENNYDDDELHTVQSFCGPTSEGGGAVAHLILFPDLLNDCNLDMNMDMDMDGSDDVDGDGNGNNSGHGNISGHGKILELPVRKCPVPITRNYSSVSSIGAGVSVGGVHVNTLSRHQNQV